MSRLLHCEGMTNYKLCGGTALARCWLEHRVSYDLDLFFPEGFDARTMSAAIKRAGINLQVTDMVDDPKKANQLHGYIDDGELLKVSFVEDAYYDIYPAIIRSLGGVNVATEDIAGLYHRKLRTVSGNGSGDTVEGGRQKARDVFDLYVLSKTHMPLLEFMDTVPYSFPKIAFFEGLAAMPWFELIDELGEIVCDEQWESGKDVEIVQNGLLMQIGAQIIVDEVSGFEL
ncbi:MAG: nucleotidyl transferase AbiEii/AbiGii toxin family protein [Sideroxyarcus sp.]|nr:nucleotidyl transferase AbiEii/AbiGii toxin family protein [Sideroxyarcus sp.]